jgi:hypothetical protein
MAKKRNYKREYALYHGKPKQIKRRAKRNKSRRMLARQGLVRKGDGKDVHHRDHNVANTSRSNLAIISKSKNRSMK